MKEHKKLTLDEMEQVNGGVILGPIMLLPLIQDIVKDLFN